MRKLIFILALCLLGINFIGTLSLFESNVKAPVEATIAGWSIKVNNNLIGEQSEFTINDVIWKDNDNIKDGKTAPGAVGYFDLEIVPEDVDVAFTYEFIVDENAYENGNFKILSIETEDEDIVIDKNKYSGIFSLEDIKNNKISKARFSLIWENNEENNELDSEYIGIDKEINIPITINFSQYLGD